MNVSSRLPLNEEIDGDLPFDKVNGWGLLITTSYYLLLLLQGNNKQTEAKCANENNCKDELFQLTAQLACAQEEIHFLESLLRRAKSTNNQLIHSSRNITNSESGNCIKHIVPTNSIEQDSIILNNKAMDKKQHIKHRKRWVVAIFDCNNTIILLQPTLLEKNIEIEICSCISVDFFCPLLKEP